jgi:hypothetical protein
VNEGERRYVQMFVNWLYTHGPDPNMVTREKLVLLYEEWLAAQSNVSRWEAWRESRGTPQPA